MIMCLRPRIMKVFQHILHRQRIISNLRSVTEILLLNLTMGIVWINVNVSRLTRKGSCTISDPLSLQHMLLPNWMTEFLWRTAKTLWKMWKVEHVLANSLVIMVLLRPNITVQCRSSWRLSCSKHCEHLSRVEAFGWKGESRLQSDITNSAPMLLSRDPFTLESPGKPVGKLLGPTYCGHRQW
jgi:hypothetical protein